MRNISNAAEKRKKKFGRLILWTILIIFAGLQFFPMVWIVDFSLAKDTQLFGSDILIWPESPQWQNYVMAWTNGHVLRYSLNSMFVVVCTIVITVFFSLTLGYAFTRMRWRHSKAVLSFVLLGMMIPIHTTLLPNFLIYQKLHLLDTPLALILPYSAFSIPLGVFIMTGFMESLPVSLEEAAVIDGCGVMRIIFQIAFPLTKSAVATIAVMTFINNWNEFIMASTFLSTPTWKTLPFSVYEFAGQYTSRYAVQFAVMVLASIPALVVYALLNEQITKGVTFGAVKE
ncbi:MAG: carbohydrate ABC transporter permease [Eubacteriales bacterium]|nr:carbohydrate ABC transporter permease [Eubacteriales bacterium]